MISVRMSPNEQGSRRAAGLANTLLDDARFEWAGYENIPVDLQFATESVIIHPNVTDLRPGKQSLIFNCELKEPADYVASALGPSGHLYEQILTMRESGDPGMVLVLGSDADIEAACMDALKTRYKGKSLAFQFSSYLDRLLDFEANSEALGVPVRHWKARPWRRILSTAHKVLTGGSLLGYRPKPANGERDVAACSMLFPGIGPELSRSILGDYDIRLVPKPDARPLTSLPGIGKTRAAIIKKRVHGV